MSKEVTAKKSYKFNFSIKNIIFLILKIFLSFLIYDFRIFDYLLNFYHIEKFIDSFSPWIYLSFPVIENFIKLFLILKLFKFQNLKKILYKEKDFISNPIILDFAPWNIINEENVLQEFFNLIKNQLRKSNNINDLDEIIKTLEKYANKVCNNFTNNCFNFKQEDDNTVLNLKKDLSKQLKKLNHKFIIFIDDVDRLTDNEILLIMKIIKSIADLPNIIYFISFDRKIVSEALNKYHKNNGDKFLEKIIQIPFELPNIQKEKIENYINKLLQSFVISFTELNNIWNEQYAKYWDAITFQGFYDYFNNLRDIHRYFNALEINYNPEIHNEVNFIDFLIVNIWQLFYKELYDFIRQNASFFTRDFNKLTEEEKEIYRNEIEKCFKNVNIKQKEILKAHLITLFPNITGLYHGIYSISMDSEEERRITGRICCYEHFIKFFSYQNIPNEITLTEMHYYIDISKSIENFSKIFLELENRRKTKLFLQKLEDYIEILSEEQCINIIQVLLDIGDYLELYNEGFWSSDIYANIDRIIYKILKKNISNKYQILLESINKSKSLYPSLSYVDLLIRSLTHTDGAIYQDYVNSEQCEKLKNLVLEKLNIWARNTLNGLKNDLLPFDGNLLKHHMFYWILIFWFDNGDKESLAVFINAITESDKGLINFLNIIKQEVKISDSNGCRTLYRYNKNSLLKFFKQEYILERLKSINNSENKTIINAVIDCLNDVQHDFEL